jgi:hypothetical protein
MQSVTGPGAVSPPVTPTPGGVAVFGRGVPGARPTESTLAKLGLEQPRYPTTVTRWRKRFLGTVRWIMC